MNRRAALIITLLTCCAATAADDELSAAFEKDVLVIVASAHACYQFDIYLAISAEQTRRGLMHVREMPRTTGMLFIYDSDDYYSMWMKNTLIPLDMVFARSDGSVSSVIRNTEPQSLRSNSAIEPVRYVLELNAGVTASLVIDENSRLIWVPTAKNDE